MNYSAMLNQLLESYKKLDGEVKLNLSFDSYIRFVTEANRK